MTRLYPILPKTSNMEKLVNVPAGTWAKVIEIQTKYDTHNQDDLLFEKLEDSNVMRLYEFSLFGWGRMKLAKSVLGYTTDRNEMTEILTAQGLPLSLLDEIRGLNWS